MESAMHKRDRAIMEYHIMETAITWDSCKKGHSYNGKSYHGICYNIKSGKSHNMKYIKWNVLGWKLL